MLVPARIPPHKPVDDEPGVKHRLEMCRVAVEGARWLEVSDLEVQRPGPSYTVDTLEELSLRTPDSDLSLIVGADVAVGLPSWHQPERVLSLAVLSVAQRPGTARAAVERALAQVPGGDRACFFDMPEIGISSTMLRDRVRAGQPTKYLMPDAVREYIDSHGIYRGSPDR